MSSSKVPVPGGLGMASGSDIPIGHLDYDYIKDCTDAVELEKIITVLRSGSEGYYPQLVESAEKKLKEIHPKSDVLRKDNPVQHVNELDAEEQKAVTEELFDWMNEANDMDKKLKDSNPEAEVNHVGGLPPVRSKKTIVDDGKKENVLEPKISNSKKSVKPRDFKEWDKFDVDKELENVDKMDQPKENGVENKSPTKIQPVATKDLNAEERLFRAVKEKEKGNEAFRAQDYDEAVVYYTNSLKYEPTAASYNNRAAAELKIEKYPEAIEDCNKVLELEPWNIKALLRRGLAYKGLERYVDAVNDFKSLLEIDPKNKRAKDLLAEVETSRRDSEKSKLQSNNSEANKDVKNETPNNDNAGAETKKKGQRLKIEEIESINDVIIQNRVQDVGPVNEKSKEKSQPETVEKSELDTSEKILEDLKVINSVKEEEEGMSLDNLVNGETVKQDEEKSIPRKKKILIQDVDGEDDKNKQDEEKSIPRKKKILIQDVDGEDDKNTDLQGSQAGYGVDGCLATGTKAGLKDEAINETACYPGESKASENVEKVENKQEVVLELPEAVKTLMKEGNDLYKMGHHSDAVLKYGLCIERLWPDRDSYANAVSGIFNNKAACYFKMGDCKQCVLECNESLKLVENNLSALKRRGKAYETMEKYAEAFRDFNRVRLIDTSDSLAQENCSRVVKHLEMLHGKSWRKKIFEVSQNDDSKHQGNVDAKNKANPTKLYGSVDESQKSSPHPDNSPNAGKKGPVDGVPRENKEETEESVKEKFSKLKEKGNSFVKKGNFEEAIKCYTDCADLCSKEVAIYTNRALCYLKQAKYDLAETDCNTALSIETDNIKALFRRAKARKGLGRYRDASNDLVQLLKVDGKNKDAQRELTTVLGLLKKKEDEKKPVPKRKKILIQDVDGEDVKNPDIAAPEQTTTSAAKKKQNGTNSHKEAKPKTPSTKTAPKNHTKENSTIKASQKEIKKQTDKVVEEKKRTNLLTETNPKENIKTDNSVVKPSRQENQKPKSKSNVKSTKGSETSSIEYNDKSAFQFLQDWQSVKSNDASEYLNILKQINLPSIPKVLSTKLDGDMIKSMLEALKLEMEQNGDVKFVYQFLQKLILVDRFDMTLMFLSQLEKQVARTLFDEIERQNNEQVGISVDDLSQLRRKYRI